MIWKPREERTYVYLKHTDNSCISIRTGCIYDNDYKKEAARKSGCLIAPQELARWMD